MAIEQYEGLPEGVKEKEGPQIWRVTIYRVDSPTPVTYDDVKHVWWEGDKLVISQMSEPGKSSKHHYWTWPEKSVSHVKTERV